MTPLDRWDVLVVGMIFAFAFTIAPVRATLAPALVAMVFLEAIYRIWTQAERAGLRKERGG